MSIGFVLHYFHPQTFFGCKHAVYYSSFFGSFNPVHIGHLALANYIIEYTDLDQLWFVISPHNPLKKKESLLSDQLRLEILELAIEDNKRFAICDIEFRMPKPSYTIDTLTYLKERYLGVAKAHRYRMHHLKPTLPMPSGGITPGMVLRVMQDLGNDMMIGSGGGIHAHPKGPVAGAKAFRQAIDIGMKDMAAASEDFEDYVEDHEDEYPELAQAMETWGVSDTRF